jgi:hypothetical protein
MAEAIRCSGRHVSRYCSVHLCLVNGTRLSKPSRYSDWLRTGRPRSRSSSPGRVKNFVFSTSSRPALGPTQLPIQWVPGVKRTGREADHSPPTSAKVKKMWIYTSTPPYAFIRDNFTLPCISRTFPHVHTLAGIAASSFTDTSYISSTFQGGLLNCDTVKSCT